MSIISDIFTGGASGVLEGVGKLAKDIRTAITGKEPIDATKVAEIALKVQELESAIEQGRLAIVLAESQSQDKWTSRGRPLFLYVIYIMLLSGIPMGIVYAVSPSTAANITTGFSSWLRAIPPDLYALFGAGYLGYGAFRTYDKKQGTIK
jgi:hypothetical protein